MQRELGAQDGGYRAHAEMFSELIGAIYDCVMTPENWPLVLEAINRQFSFASSALGVSPLRPAAQIVHATAGIDPEWLSIGPRYDSEIIALWGGAERMGRHPLDEPIVHSRTFGYRGREDNLYFREVLEPRGLIDGVIVAIAREPLLLGYVGLSRHSSAGEIHESEIDGLRLLAPHFRRAVTISNLFDMKEIKIGSFESVLDGFAFGIVLVDERLGVIHANPIAAGMLAARDPFELRKGALAMREKDANAALERAVRQAGVDESRLGTAGIGIPARRAEGEPCVIHVLPLGRGKRRSGLTQRAVAALFVTRAEGQSRVPSDSLALLYDLTPAETRILELLHAGIAQKDIGDLLGVARSTVKTHVLRLFDKTGCKRQVDLVRLAARLSSPA